MGKPPRVFFVGIFVREPCTALQTGFIEQSSLHNRYSLKQCMTRSLKMSVAFVAGTIRYLSMVLFHALVLTSGKG